MATCGGFAVGTMKIAILIDGGHVRALAQMAQRRYTPELVASLAHSCAVENEQIMRILYYDCAPYSGTVKLPVSGKSHDFKGNDRWCKDLAAKELFAVRLGTLKFRGYKPKRIPIKHENPSDDDFKPDFEQKGVDMRIGLDIALFSVTQAAERILIITGDTDCIPAMKHGRKAGLQMALVSLPEHSPAPELLWHADFHRKIAWPAL